MWFDRGAWPAWVAWGALTGLLAVALLLVATGSAWPRMHYPARGHRIVPATVGALDGFTTPSGAYSFRKLRSAYAGPAVKLQRVDTTTSDIGFTAAGDFDTAAAAAFCTTACGVQTWYDQSGNGRHLVQATAASQLQYIANCTGTLVCARSTAAQDATAGGTVTPATGVVSFSAVANRVSGTGICAHRQNGAANRLSATSGLANNWSLAAGTALSVTASDNAWHTVQGVINGAGTVINIEGVETTGSVAGSVAVGAHQIVGAATTTCNFGEFVIWDNYALTPAERTALANNQKSYWAPLPLDTFAAPAAAYSFRKLKSSYAGPAVRLRRASDNAELDINFLGFVPGLGAPVDMVQANSFCASTTCTLVAWYDQSPSSRHMTQGVPANQPLYVANCLNSLPCIELTLGGLGSASAAWSLKSSFGAVANRVSGPTGTCVWLRRGTHQFVGFTTAATWQVSDGATAAFTMPVSDATWHAAIGNIDGAASIGRVDGTEMAGTTIAGSTTAGGILTQGVAGSVCRIAEGVVWDNYALTLSERAALTANQKSFWGTP